MIFIKLFFTFFLVGIMTYGGGYSVLPLVDDLVVNKAGWLTKDAVADIVSISEMSPGPFSLNCATFVGTKIAGIPGGILATIGFITPSLIIVLILSYYYNKYHEVPAVKQVFAVLNACIIAVLISSAIQLLTTSVFIGSLFDANVDVVALAIFIVSFVAIFKFKLNPVIIIFVSAAAGTFIYPLIK